MRIKQGPRRGAADLLSIQGALVLKPDGPAEGLQPAPLRSSGSLSSAQIVDQGEAGDPDQDEDELLALQTQQDRQQRDDPTGASRVASRTRAIAK